MYPAEQVAQSPSESQAVHPALLPLVPQHWPPRQVPEEQEGEEEQDLPSEMSVEALVVVTLAVVVFFEQSSQSVFEA